jgi:hypothetical protein
MAGDESAGVPKLRQIFPMGIEMQYYVHNFLTVPRSDPPWISELFLLLDARSFHDMRRRKGNVLSVAGALPHTCDLRRHFCHQRSLSTSSRNNYRGLEIVTFS